MTLDLIQKKGFLYDSSLQALDEPYEIVSRGKPTGLVELAIDRRFRNPEHRAVDVDIFAPGEQRVEAGPERDQGAGGYVGMVPARFGHLS